MSQQSLKDLLAGLQGDEKTKAAMDRAATGEGSPSGAYDIDLPAELEYRVELVDTKFGPAKTSGKPTITITFEVLEPADYVGARFQEYYQPKPDNEASSRKLGELIGSVQADASGFADNDLEGYVGSFKGSKVVVCIRKWGEDLDRAGVRFMSADRGQSLRTNIKPQQSKKTTPSDLRPDIQIPKDESATTTPPVTPPVEPETAQTPAETTSLPGGVNLPPGLGGRS